jgi:transposase
MYILSTGCQWRYIPKDFPPRSTAAILKVANERILGIPKSAEK